MIFLSVKLARKLRSERRMRKEMARSHKKPIKARNESPKRKEMSRRQKKPIKARNESLKRQKNVHAAKAAGKSAKRKSQAKESTPPAETSGKLKAKAESLSDAEGKRNHSPYMKEYRAKKRDGRIDTFNNRLSEKENAENPKKKLARKRTANHIPRRLYPIRRKGLTP